MTKLETLIQTLCPNGVKFVKLGEVVKVLRGKRLTKSDLLSEALYNVYHGGIDPLGKYNEANREGNTVMVINVGASAGSVGFSKDAFWSSDGCFCLSKNDLIDSKFLYYYLLTQEKHLQSKVRKAGIPTLDSLVIESLQIPLPPLAVQSEIVRLLDKFTLYKSELAAELAARCKQYEHYRNQLLTFDENTKRVKLGEVAKIKNGKDYKKFGSGLIPVYGSGGIMTYIDTFVYDAPSVLIPRKGSLSNLFYVDTPFWNVDTIFYTEINNAVVLPKFLFYILQNMHLETLNKAGGVPSLTQDILNRVEFPLPPLEVQKQIVAILDRFDKLCHDIREGLPAEIELRQKQYEHYRDRLLTFRQLGD